MKQVILKVLCYLGAIMILLIGLVPITRIFQQAWHADRLDYYDNIYFNYHGILAIIVLLGSIAGAAALFWIARQLKAK